MQYIIRFAVLLSLSLQPAFAFAATTTKPIESPIELPAGMTEREKKLLFRVCNRADESHKIRCFHRQLQKMGYVGGKAPLNALEVWEGIDLGGYHRRASAQKALQEKVADRVQTRKTYSQLQPTDDLNTQRVDYLNDIRMERLRCMKDVPVGRPRSLCMDALKAISREKMQQRMHERPVPPR